MNGKFMRYVAGVMALAALTVVAHGEALAQVPVPTACGQYSASAGRPGQQAAIEVWLAAAPRQGYGYLGDAVEVWANGVKIGAVPTNRLVVRRDGSIGVGTLLIVDPCRFPPGIDDQPEFRLPRPGILRCLKGIRLGQRHPLASPISGPVIESFLDSTAGSSGRMNRLTGLRKPSPVLVIPT